MKTSLHHYFSQLPDPRIHRNKKHLLDAFIEVALSQIPLHMKTKPSKWVVDTELNLNSHS